MPNDAIRNLVIDDLNIPSDHSMPWPGRTTQAAGAGSQRHSRGSRGLEHVSKPSHRPDRRTVRLELSAKPGDMYFKGIGRDCIVVAVDFREQPLLRHHLAGL